MELGETGLRETLPHSAKERDQTGKIVRTEKWIAHNPLRFLMIIIGCFLCSLILHLNFGDIFSDQPDVLRHSLIGSWIVGTMCAYIYADQLPPVPVQTREKKKPLFHISPQTRRILGIMVLWTLLITSLSMCIYIRTGTSLWSFILETPARATATVTSSQKHDFLKETDRELLEGEILSLLFISADDYDRNGLSGGQPVDMRSRRKYFSDDAWQQYQSYVASQKRRLIAAQGTGFPLKAKSEFVDGTRKYETLGDTRSFSAQGIFLDGRDTSFTRSDTFKINITYAPAGASGEVLINSWSVRADNLN